MVLKKRILFLKKGISFGGKKNRVFITQAKVAGDH